MNPVVNSAAGFPLDHESIHEAAAPPRTGSRLVGITAGPAIRPQKRRGRSRRNASLEKRIEDLASCRSEFRANLRKPIGFLGAFLELVDLMGTEFPTSSPGLKLAASPRRL